MAKAKAKPKQRAVDPRLTLTRELIELICASARKGNFRATIARGLAISNVTWDSWLERGKREIRDLEAKGEGKLGLKGQLVLELMLAESSVQSKIHADILDSDDLNLKLKFLKLRYPRQYSGLASQYTDDESGGTIDTSAVDLLTLKLASFLGSTEDPS